MLFCSQRCRQSNWRFRRGLQLSTDAAEVKRLAFADPPYPRLARRYYQTHTDYRGEVDHAELVSRLQAYDGGRWPPQARLSRWSCRSFPASTGSGSGPGSA